MEKQLQLGTAIQVKQAKSSNRDPFYELRSTQCCAATQFRFRASSPLKVQARAQRNNPCGFGIKTGIGEDLRLRAN
jgi:hypothetical protein